MTKYYRFTELGRERESGLGGGWGGGRGVDSVGRCGLSGEGEGEGEGDGHTLALP